MTPTTILAATTAPAPAPVAPSPSYVPFLIGALVTIVVTIVMGAVNVRSTRQLTRLTLDEQRAQPNAKADHDRAANLRTAQHTAYLAFLKDISALLVACDVYSADPADLEPGRWEGTETDETSELPQPLRERAGKVRESLAEVRLAGGPKVGTLARAVFGQVLRLADQGVSVAHQRFLRAAVPDDDVRGADHADTQLAEYLHAYRMVRAEYAEARRVFLATVRAQLWGPDA
ncbi:hypothetical protein ACSHWO_38195 (plasmid) [Streptomyces sp. HUAS TT3]|uniref:hypothetical protein n=1 Tax=Streptomyces sp. HUAS TT3 TaxID=3447510 RepID=UPI003F65C893